MIQTRWALITLRDGTHIIPIDDTGQHTYYTVCKCCPEAGEDENEGLIIHHSFDGREPFESGERKVS